MSELAAIKALSRETKALILVSEYEARRMPVFQLRAVLELLVNDPQEQKAIVDMVENDLRATGYPPDAVSAFLSDLLSTAPPKSLPPEDEAVLTTRKLRSPFAMDFEGGAPPADAEVVPAIPAPQVAPRPRASKILPAVPQQEPVGTAPVPPAPGGMPFFGKGKTIAMGPPPDIPPPAGTAPVPQAPQVAPRPRASSILPAISPPAQAGQPYFGKGRTSMMGPPPPDAFAPPPPPFPASPPSAPPGGVQRRSTFVHTSPPAQAAAGPAAPEPSSPEALMPMGQKALRRHEILFGGKEAAAGPAMGPKPLVLIADDDKRARMVFRIRIEEAGYETVECGSGDEAWERIRQGGVAVAVLDMKMPGLHGLEVLSNIADKCPGMPVVICTAYDQLQEEFAVKTYPKLKYLVKPIAPEALVQAIKELLGAKSTA